MVVITLLIILIIIALILIYISNNCLKVTRYIVKNNKIPESFDGLKIVHISDVHSKIFGKNNYKFFEKINEINPDMIFMTGDIIDDSEKNIKGYVNIYKELFKRYPIYYSIGNHERKLGYNKYKEYISLLKENGVNVIVNGSTYFKKGNEKIKINALKFRENMQPRVLTIQKKDKYINYMKKKLNDIDTNEFNVLLAHDPENFEMYEKLKVDLVFSGHVHGGLIRFGKVCLLSPRRRFFPKYSYGKNTINKTTIITSSGIGSATIPIRLFNRPEIVEVILKR